MISKELRKVNFIPLIVRLMFPKVCTVVCSRNNFTVHKNFDKLQCTSLKKFVTTGFKIIFFLQKRAAEVKAKTVVLPLKWAEKKHNKCQYVPVTYLSKEAINEKERQKKVTEEV